MPRRNIYSLILLVVSIFTCWVSTAYAALPRYQVVDLGLLPGFPVTIPTDLNDRGEVIGTLFSNSDPFISRPFYWSMDKGLQEFSLPNGGSDGDIHHINNSGFIVGVSGNDDPISPRVPFLWTEVNGFQSLPELVDTSIADVSENGTLVGDFRQPGKIGHVFRWSETEGLLELPRTGHGPDALWQDPRFGANNELGVISGGIRVGNSAGSTEAALWTEETGFQPIGKLPEISLTTSIEVNDHNQVIGLGTFTLDGLGVSRSFFWSEETGIVRLVDLPGNNYNRARDIDNLGRVVGSSFSTRNGATRGFLWTIEEGMLELNHLLDPTSQDWFIRRAVSINERGWILASGRKDLQLRSVLLVPVPEPNTLLLGVLAVGGLMAVRRRNLTCSA